ncbi:MAG: hypothetical protein EAZ95_14890 [Bacteroidetes bacterium]|nr:MAG: hypothetical protein EAZ95_14890 [Bacteroidota bacterium]
MNPQQQQAFELIDRLKITEFFAFMEEKVGANPSLTHLEQTFIMGNLPPNYYEQLRLVARQLLADKKPLHHKTNFTTYYRYAFLLLIGVLVWYIYQNIDFTPNPDKQSTKPTIKKDTVPAEKEKAISNLPTQKTNSPTNDLPTVGKTNTEPAQNQYFNPAQKIDVAIWLQGQNTENMGYALQEYFTTKNVIASYSFFYPSFEKYLGSQNSSMQALQKIGVADNLPCVCLLQQQKYEVKNNENEGVVYQTVSLAYRVSWLNFLNQKTETFLIQVAGAGSNETKAQENAHEKFVQNFQNKTSHFLHLCKK